MTDMPRTRTYVVEFHGREFTRTTEHTYPWASYVERDSFDSPVAFHKLRDAAKRRAGRWGEVKETTLSLTLQAIPANEYLITYRVKLYEHQETAEDFASEVATETQANHLGARESMELVGVSPVEHVTRTPPNISDPAQGGAA